VESLMFEGRPGVRVPLSISAGVAVFPRDGDTHEVLLAKADRRMYRNKVLHKRGEQAKPVDPPTAPNSRAAS
jgi:GGDEF domain-containing protein